MHENSSVTTVVEAGRLTEADNTVAIFHLHVDQARQIAQWLALATGGDVYLRHISVMSRGWVDLKVAHADELDRLERARSRRNESTAN